MASADALTKYALPAHSLSELVVMRFGLIALACTPLLWLQQPDVVAVQFWWWLALIVPAEFAATVLYIKAIRLSPLSLTLPYLAFTPILVVIPAYFALDEVMTVTGLLGVVMVVGGAFYLHGNNGITLRGLVMAPFREPGSGLMLIVAGLYAVTTVGAKGALQHVPAGFFVPVYFWILTLLSLPLLVQKRHSFRSLVRLSRWHGLLALALGVATITHFVGIQLVEVAYFIAVKRTSLLFGIVYGVVLFQEGQPARRVVAGLVIVAGVIIVSLRN